MNHNRPAELVMIHQPVGLVDLGSSFNAQAPFRACRLCGALYQSTLDLRQYAMWLMDDVDPGSGYVEIMQAALSRRQKWEEVHNKREHPDAEKLVKQLNAAGWAMFPEAAERLTPYGIFPTGNMHDEIINAMATAPRAPLHEHEGGER